MKIQLLNDRFTFKLLKNDEKKYMLTYSFFCFCISTEVPITATVPGSRCTAHGRNIFIWSNKTFQVLTFENIH